MPDQAWKAFERRIAKVFGGIRRGADTRSADGGKCDVIHDHFAIECKLVARPNHSTALDACRQAERNAKPHQEPVVVIKRKNAHDRDALVVQRLEVFEQWRLGDGSS
jgi:hypothetical protein